MAYSEKRDVAETAVLTFAPSAAVVLSWNAHAPEGALAFRLLRAGAPVTPWLDHMRWSASERTSLNPSAAGVTVDTDVIRADRPFDGVEVRASGVHFDLIAASTPQLPGTSLPYAGSARILDVPARSQFVFEDKRGWCSPTSLSMLHAYHGIDISVPDTAAAVHDTAYEGTGNWSFNVAYSGALGFRASVVHLPNLDRALQFIERNLPLAISYHWRDGELPGAPIDHSDGHFVVLTGFTDSGDCAVNDPAHPDLRVVYPRAAVERIWQRSGGVAYAVAPVGLEYADLL